MGQIPTADFTIAGHEQWQGDDSIVTEKTAFVVRTQKGWKKLWDLAGEEAPMDRLPMGTMAVAVFAGEGLFETRAPSIESVEQGENGILVFWKENSMLIAEMEENPAFTQCPYVIKLIPYSRTANVEFLNTGEDLDNFRRGHNHRHLPKRQREQIPERLIEAVEQERERLDADWALRMSE